MFRGTRVACDGTKAASAKRLAGRNILQVPENRRRRGFQGDSPAERETRKAVFGHSSVNVVSGHYSSSYTMLLAQAQMRHWDGKPLPNAYRATTARAAPPPHEVFERLDGLGMVWTDRSVASLLEGVVVYVTTKYEQRVSKTKNAPTKRVVDAVYLREHAAPLVRHIHRWGNAAINNGTSRGLFYTLAIAGCDTRLVKALAREEPSDADAAASPAAEGLFRGRVRGFAMLRDTEGIDAVLAEMERRGVERSPALRAVLTAYYADEGLLDRLGAECGGSLEAVPTQSLRVVAASARDNFQPSLALAALCEMQARGEMDLTQDYTRRPGEEPGETLMQTVWGTFFQLRDEADIVKATALLRTWTVDVLEEGRRVAKRNNVTADLRRAPRGFPMPTLLDEVSPYAPYVAPFDALVLAACDAGRLDLALAVCNEAVFPTEPFAVLHPDACRRMLALAAEDLLHAAAHPKHHRPHGRHRRRPLPGRRHRVLPELRRASAVPLAGLPRLPPAARRRRRPEGAAQAAVAAAGRRPRRHPALDAVPDAACRRGPRDPGRQRRGAACGAAAFHDAERAAGDRGRHAPRGHEGEPGGRRAAHARVGRGRDTVARGAGADRAAGGGGVRGRGVGGCVRGGQACGAGGRRVRGGGGGVRGGAVRDARRGGVGEGGAREAGGGGGGRGGAASAGGGDVPGGGGGAD
eukprot:Rhum_TRINITY_DN7741_c0_g1::Rhum_TRINITY_DN7741_c0_g1_i1::g.24318::m.24318